MKTKMQKRLEEDLRIMTASRDEWRSVAKDLERNIQRQAETIKKLQESSDSVAVVGNIIAQMGISIANGWLEYKLDEDGNVTQVRGPEVQVNSTNLGFDQ